MTQLKKKICGHAPSGTSHTNRHTGCWLVNAITAESLNQQQPNSVNGNYLGKFSLGLKIGSMDPPLLVPPIQIDKSGRLDVKQDNSRKPFLITINICQQPQLRKAYDILENIFYGRAPSGTSHTNRHIGRQLFNAITAENFNRSQQNFSSGYCLSKFRSALKMGFLAKPLLVPPTQICKSGRLAGKQDNSEKTYFPKNFQNYFFFAFFLYCLQKN